VDLACNVGHVVSRSMNMAFRIRQSPEWSAVSAEADGRNSDDFAQLTVL
jgi:hypothetical protein